jgi:hypothetical protein
MTNRIPLIVDTSDSNKIKELPIGDNLDITGSGIVGATSILTTSITAETSVLNNISANTITVNVSADLGSVENLVINGGTAGQVLITDGAGNLSWSTLGNYNQNLNNTDNVQFNFINARRLEAPINVTAEIRTSSSGSGTKTWQFTSTGDLYLPGSLIGDVTGNITGHHTGDVQGSVFGDDSTMLVDGINNKVLGPIEVNINDLNITGGSPDLVLKVNSQSLMPEWGYSTRLQDGSGSISHAILAPNEGWRVSNGFPFGEWLFRESGDLRLPTGFTDITDAQDQSLLRGNWGVVNIARDNAAGSWPFNGIGSWALPATTRVWNSSTIILDYDTWEALRDQYPSWLAGDPIPNDLICSGTANPGDPFNNFGKIMTPTEFDITTSGGYITDVRVSQAGINQSVVSGDHLHAFLPGDGLEENTLLPATGIIGRIPALPTNYQDSGLTLNQGQLVVNPINVDSTIEPVVARFYGDVAITGDLVSSSVVADNLLTGIQTSTIVAGVLTLDFTFGTHIVNHNANITTVNFTNASASKSSQVTVILTQDGVGGRTITGSYATAGGFGLDISTAANAVNIVSFFTRDNSTFYGFSNGKNFS